MGRVTILGYTFVPTGGENILGEPFYWIYDPNGNLLNPGRAEPFASPAAMDEWLRNNITKHA